ncbi:hypothetical protein [Pseudacidovorax intermedius]|uniref:Uncharacterized protein n=1 Tax=Pseudacidovorax intermedius TaxID=433924 RepID=A0A147GP54_9BURK|nr:hypothetical protein [Pseudacidovorax intermedius]KTT16140.1 hypothetical protein NS331_19320 [Pseudacidovorax intermedius]
MFTCESGFLVHRKNHGQREAVELIADINEYTTLLTPKNIPTKRQAKTAEFQPRLLWMRTLFDHNEHFIELSNMGEEDRSLDLMLTGLFLGLILFGFAGAIFLTGNIRFGDFDYVKFGFEKIFYFLFVWIFPLGALWFNFMLWPLQYAPNFFTSLRARYRFNRTTRKVYVLRPARYGGNVILDWDRVQAHVNWCAPRGMTHDDLRDPQARRFRQENAGGEFRIQGLLLYWPPFDKDDPERKGEDVLWVGPKMAGENLWQYIRTFMEEGMDAVPEPNEYEWLRKGFHTPSQHLEETVMGPSRVLDRIGGRAAPGSTSMGTNVNFLMNVLWAPLHCLSERLCTWPTFPEEWNSDCGQRRREDGIGPEEPLRWTPKP